MNKSSRMVADFLEEMGLSKKDFAEMIGVTLSYVYTLVDENIPFSTRTTTLERVATVLGIIPKEFPEYKVAEEPKTIDLGVQFLIEQQKKLGITNLQLIKKFPRAKRLDIVDLLRGAKPLPLDWNILSAITRSLELPVKSIYPYWRAGMVQHFASGGIDIIDNANLIAIMFKGIEEFHNMTEKVNSSQY